MKKALVVGFLMSLTGFLVFSVKASESPLAPEVEAAIAAQKHIAVAVWNPGQNSIDGSSTLQGGIHPLTAGLPAKAIITNSYGFVATQLVDAGTASSTASVVFQCEDYANIMSGTTNLNSLPANTIFNLKQFGNSTVPVGGANIYMTAQIQNPCTITAQVLGDNFSAGKVVLFVEYVVAQ